MTAAVLERPSLFAERRSVGEPAHGPTLESVLTAAFTEARTNGSTECPVCHARMTLTRAGAHEAECGGCRSRLG